MQLKEPAPEASGKKSKYKKAKANSQHSSENCESSQARASASSREPQVSAYLYEMRGHVQQTVDEFLELSGKTRE